MTALADPTVGTPLATILAKSDMQLASHIQGKLPDGTFSSVEVNTINYTFTNTVPDGIRTRKITLSLSAASHIYRVFHALISGLGIGMTQDYDKHIEKDTLQNQLISIIKGTSESREQLILAYKQAKTIHLYISQDCNHVYLELEGGTGTTVAYTIGSVLKIATVIPLLISSFTQKSSNSQ